MYLEPWTEIKGKLLKISQDEQYFYLDFDGSILVLRKEFTESVFNEEDLSGFVGKEIAILRTDIPEKPLIVRLIKLTNLNRSLIVRVGD